MNNTVNPGPVRPMQSRFNLLFLLSLLSVNWIPPAVATDLDKERRWSDQIVDGLVVGEALELKAGDTGFLGIFAKANQKPGDRAVILLHGMGAHPDWPEVINPLRSSLPDHGWATLSIQMPVLANDAKLEAYAPLFDNVAARIDAAISYLQDSDYKTLVLAGHSLGASMAAYYLASGERPKIRGLIAIGMGVIEQDNKMNSALALEKIRIPVLDLFGSRDLDVVVNTAKKRASASRLAGNVDYRQLQIEGADHFFVGTEDTMDRRIYGWLKTHFETPPR